MYLPKFTLESPKTIQEAVSLMDAGQDTKLLSGGTDLFPRMKYKLCTTEVLVGLQSLPKRSPQIDNKGNLVIDANMSLTAVTLSFEILEQAPLLALAAQKVATREIRNMGTLGGNICQEVRCLYLNQSHTFQFIEPCLKRGGEKCYFLPKGKKCWAVFMSDIAPALCCLDASVGIADSNGEHQISIMDLYTGDALKPLSLKPGQIITRIIIPKSAYPSGSGFAKFTVRHTIEFAVVNAGVYLETEKDLKTCRRVKIAVGAISEKPQRVPQVESWMTGKELTHENIDTATQKTVGIIKVIPHHGYSKRYLVECLKTQLKQAFNDAVKSSADKNN